MGSTNVHRLRFLAPAPVETDAATIRAAAHYVANGVCVVTVGVGEARAGLTAVSVSLLSPEPARLLVCLNSASAVCTAFARSGLFAVNVLGVNQREVAEHFAGLSASPSDIGWAPLADQLLYLADCAPVFECEVEETIERHSKIIVIGRVRRALIDGGSGALVRWRGAYDQLGWSRDEISRAVGLRPGAGA